MGISEQHGKDAAAISNNHILAFPLAVLGGGCLAALIFCVNIFFRLVVHVCYVRSTGTFAALHLVLFACAVAEIGRALAPTRTVFVPCLSHARRFDSQLLHGMIPVLGKAALVILAFFSRLMARRRVLLRESLQTGDYGRVSP